MVFEAKKDKLIFGKRHIWYVLECIADVTNRLGTGIVGKGQRILTTKNVKLKANSILIDVKSTILKGVNGNPLSYKMIFKSEEEAVKYWTYKKGGSIFNFYPERKDGEPDFNVAE